MTTTFANNSNANRAARKLIAAGKAPATAFDIIKVDGAFAIEWAKPEAEKPAKVAERAKAAALPGDDKAGAVAAAKGMLLGDKQSRRAGLEKLVRLGVADAEVDAALSAADEQIAKTAAPKQRTRATRAPAGAMKPPRAGGKHEAVVALLARATGATVPEIAKEMGWLPHTTRAFISVTIRRKLGHQVTTEKVASRGTVYRIAA